MRFKIDDQEREIPDEVFRAIEDAKIGRYVTPQDAGVAGLTWVDRERWLISAEIPESEYFDEFRLTIFDNKIRIGRTIVSYSFQNPEVSTYINFEAFAVGECRNTIRALKIKGIASTREKEGEGRYTAYTWIKTWKKFEELTVADIQRPLETFKVYRQMPRLF